MKQWAGPKAGHRDRFRARHRRRARRYWLAARSSFLPGLEKPRKSAVFASAPGLFSRSRPRTDVWPRICMSSPGCVRKWNSPMRVQRRRSAPHSAAVEAGDAFKVRVATSLQAVEGAWRALESSAFCTPFQTYDWLTAYVQGARPLARREIAIVVVSSTDKLRMIVPFAVERRWGASYLRWLGHDVNDYNAPIIDLTWARSLTPDDMRHLGAHPRRVAGGGLCAHPAPAGAAR